MKKTKPFSHPRDLKGTIRRQPVVFAVYLVLRLIVLATLVSSIIRGEYESAFICLLVLALFLLPFFIQQNFGIELPSTLEIIILLFIFAAEILGELECYFITLPPLGFHAAHHRRIPLRRGGIRPRRPAQPQRADQGRAVARLCGAGGVLLLHDHGRAVGVLRVRR